MTAGQSFRSRKGIAEAANLTFTEFIFLIAALFVVVTIVLIASGAGGAISEGMKKLFLTNAP